MSEKSSSLKLPPVFGIVDDDDSSHRLAKERIAFWETELAVGRWFDDHGYSLYVRPNEQGLYISEFDHFTPISCPSSSCPATTFEHDVYPYAYHSEHRSDHLPTDWRKRENSEFRLDAKDTTGNILYAQDASGRHLAFKVARTDSAEVRIAHLLKDLGPEGARENGLLPILDVLPVDDVFSFIVMPRWGDLHLVESLCKTYDDVVPVIRNFLKALAFLHHHRIIHRDIQPRNTLVNHFTYAPLQRVLARSVRLKHRRQLQCVIMDFNISIIAPPSADLRSYRLPYTTSFAGAYLQPPDVHQGEFEYNPFAFDVAAMGILLCCEFQHMSRKVPILAPLLDWMTTRDISRRCTAAEALAFFDQLVAEHPVSRERILSEHYESTGMGFERYNRWEGLPEDFVKKWSKYRKPPVPRGVLMLRWLYMRDRFSVIPRVRWFFSRAYCWTFGTCFGWLQRLWG